MFTRCRCLSAWLRASEQSPDHLQVDWLAPDKVECRRVVHMGGPAPPEGTVSYFYERTDIVGA